jgi:DNA polymerase (family 10)
VRAYRSAACTVQSLPQSVAELLEQGEDISQYKGIGEKIAEKVHEIVRTGTLHQFEQLERDVPPSLLDLLRIPELGPRRVREIYQKLGITTVEELRQVAEAHKLRELSGFGPTLESRIEQQIANIGSKEEQRLLLPQAEEIVTPLLAELRKARGVQRIQVAGSYRRGKETVGDLDILAVCEPNSDIIQRFVAYEDVRETTMHGETRSSVRLHNGAQVDLRVVPEESYGAALMYFTGSQAHNIAVRRRAQELSLKINEYGLYKGDTLRAGHTEEETYKALGCTWIPPELREDRGEMERARKGTLPELVKQNAIRGDLHAHTTASDGAESLEEMARAAAKKGYEYLAITDHTKNLGIANGLDEKRLQRQLEEIDRFNAEHTDIRLLKGSEVDILEDGSLDLSNNILHKLDIVICSIHTSFRLSRKKQTERIVRAMDNPYCTMIAHPTGRLLGKRAGYEVDVERLLQAAKERGVSMELNAQPERLDLSFEYLQRAKELSVPVAITTDAHAQSHLSYMRYGVLQARRGWLEARNVLNTRTLPALLTMIRRT